MNVKLNLAVLNKRREEITESEMIAVKGGVEPCSCEAVITSMDIASMHNPPIPLCDCNSIWVIFGFAITN